MYTNATQQRNNILKIYFALAMSQCGDVVIVNIHAYTQNTYHAHTKLPCKRTCSLRVWKRPRSHSKNLFLLCRNILCIVSSCSACPLVLFVAFPEYSSCSRSIRKIEDGAWVRTPNSYENVSLYSVPMYVFTELIFVYFLFFELSKPIRLFLDLTLQRIFCHTERREVNKTLPNEIRRLNQL